MNKLLCVISCPIDVYSGYGSRSRDLVKAFIESKKEDWDIKILSQRWGNCPWGFLDNNKEWAFLKEHILEGNQLPKQPELWMQITVPNEFQAIGKYNIGITAGIETTICYPTWIEGINRMNLTLVSSEHAKTVFLNSSAEQKNQQGQLIKVVKVEKPIEVLFEGADINTYIDGIHNGEDLEYDFSLGKIPEKWAYLFVGHWMQGIIGEDRKNVGLLIKAFYETFKNKPNTPALILKTSGAGSSYMDRREILKKINEIKGTVKASTLPRVYVIHGEFTDKEMNNLYNHYKVKAMINLTKGEGFGRPLLEFSLTGKPILTTNWSGHTDFLKPKFTTLFNGNIIPVHQSAVVKDIIIPESSWFSVNVAEVGFHMLNCVENYKTYKENAKQQMAYSKSNFSFEKMKQKFEEYLNKYMPEFPKQVPIVLPKLSKKFPTLIKPEL